MLLVGSGTMRMIHPFILSMNSFYSIYANSILNENTHFGSTALLWTSIKRRNHDDQDLR